MVSATEQIEARAAEIAHMTGATLTPLRLFLGRDKSGDNVLCAIFETDLEGAEQIQIRAPIGKLIPVLSDREGKRPCQS